MVSRCLNHEMSTPANTGAITYEMMAELYETLIASSTNAPKYYYISWSDNKTIQQNFIYNDNPFNKTKKVW